MTIIDFNQARLKRMQYIFADDPLMTPELWEAAHQPDYDGPAIIACSREVFEQAQSDDEPKDILRALLKRRKDRK